jgi:phosphate starvation-inducible PhoH-like protein
LATKKKNVESYCGAPPDTLDGHPFYGLEVSDAEQIAFRNALWNSENRFVAADACAGSGKTTIAVAVACLLCRYGRMDGVNYIRIPTVSSEGRVGFLPGTLAEKTKYYMQPLYNSLIKIGENPYTVINDESLTNQKNGTGFITAMTDVYIRGDDISRMVVIVDEAQNATIDQLRTIITRCKDDCLVVCIGSTRQIDLSDKNESGFTRCLEHFDGKPWAQICTLSKNFRGEMSAWADLM